MVSNSTRSFQLGKKRGFKRQTERMPYLSFKTLFSTTY